MTQCYLLYMNPALPTSVMTLRYVSPPILVNKSRSRNGFVMEHRHICKTQYMQSLHLSFITTLNYCIFWVFIKLYIKMLVNQHFNFLFKPVTSHCSAYCYELF